MMPPRSMGDLIERQVHLWEKQTKLGPHGPRPPVVAIARLPGALGSEIGRRVAEALSGPLFDNEIVEAIARDAGIQARMVAELDERVRGGIERFVSDSFRRGRFTESDYARHLVRTISTLASAGKAVLVGRGSAYILSSDEALRVLVVAPEAVRRERFAKAHGIEPARALEKLREADALRVEFVRHHFGLRVDDPLLYDLVLNTENLSVDGAARVVVEAYRDRARGA
jgi:cytidylate kinase